MYLIQCNMVYFCIFYVDNVTATVVCFLLAKWYWEFWSTPLNEKTLLPAIQQKCLTPHMHRNKKSSKRCRLPYLLNSDIETGRMAGGNFQVLCRNDQWLEKRIWTSRWIQSRNKRGKPMAQRTSQVNGWKKCMIWMKKKADFERQLYKMLEIQKLNKSYKNITENTTSRFNHAEIKI